MIKVDPCLAFSVPERIHPCLHGPFRRRYPDGHARSAPDGGPGDGNNREEKPAPEAYQSTPSIDCAGLGAVSPMDSIRSIWIVRQMESIGTS